jgi:hypothetical protein
LSNADHIDEETYIHLRLASVFLMTGFISDYEKPKEAACRLVEEILPNYGFNQRNIEETNSIISNSFNEKQESISDNILHDARFDYQGRIDYIRLTDKLLKEETEYGKVTDRKFWIQAQRKFLIEHEFKTATAKLLRGVSVEDQIASLQAFISEVK